MRNIPRLAAVAALLLSAALIHATLTGTPILTTLETWGQAAAVGLFGLASIIDLDFTQEAVAQAARPLLRSAFHGINAVDDITIEAFFPKSLKARIEEFNARAAQSRQNREKFDAEREAKASESVRSVTLTNDLFGVSRDAFVMLLQAEMGLRETFAAIEQEIYSALVAEADRADAAYLKSQADVTQRLLDIGYQPTPPAGISLKNCITPGMVASHPLTSAAREHAQEMRARSSSRDLANVNAEQAELIEKKLSAIRDRVLAN